MTRKDKIAIYGKVVLQRFSRRSCDAYFLMSCMILIPFLGGMQKTPITAKRQPSMTDRMLVGQKLNSRELRDDDVRR